MNKTFAFGVLLLALSVGCGSVKETNEADAGAGADAGDIEALALIASTPEEGATKVSRTAPIELVFNVALDPTTVTASSVVVRRRGDQFAVPGDLVYDDTTRTVTFSPRQLMPAGFYRVAIDGVASLEQSELSQTVEFATYLNPRTDATGYDSMGAVLHSVRYEVDERGFVVREVDRSLGVIIAVTVNTYNAIGQLLTMACHNDPGGDGEWMTSDDTFNIGFRYEYNADELQTRFIISRNAGLDNVPFTGDDEPVYWDERRYTESGRTDIRYQDAGPDGVWQTDDDDVSYSTVTSYDGLGRTNVFTRFTGPGADGNWHSVDDEVGIYFSYSRTDTTARFQNHTSSGANGVWGDDDDDIGSVAVQQFLPDGRIVSSASYAERGADGQWFTNDDVQSARLLKTYAGYSSVQYNYNDPGLDATWDTADDILSFRIEKTVNADGNEVTITRPLSPGDDGIYGNADDSVFVITHSTAL